MEKNFLRYHSDPFLTLSLPIKGQKDVIESLKTSFQPDKLDGENQYFCEELDKKIDAEKQFGRSLTTGIDVTFKTF